MRSEAGWSIGEASRRTGVKVPTIRFYEEIGLLAAPARSEGNRRQFGAAEIDRLRFIRHARQLGFEVEDIRSLLTLNESPSDSCNKADSIAKRHVAQIERRISQLIALKNELDRMINDCNHGRIADCLVLKVLADHGMCKQSHD